ncbi:MAG: molecular chaperone HtpG, partial [Kiritimatiellaeota bacterium]|nr:molecular chaperone HtpG [Kiritimatiellota bacterium]
MDTKQFKTEVKQLLDLVIHSLYSKKEIFLRELVSNASDAIDRARFEGLTHPEVVAEDAEFRITLVPNKAARTLTVSDNGVGMSAEEVEANLGTIASSGTKAFLESLKDAAGKPEMIGQFGVGFYAAFMVAESVEVETRRVGADAVRWVSDGDGSYAMEKGTKEGRGTTITLRLRPGEEFDDFLDGWRLEGLVRHYSDYIAYPVILNPDPSVKPEKAEDDKSEDGKEEAATPEEPKTINSMKAIWKRGKDEVTREELDTFYKHISHDYQNPLASIHIAAEGATEFRALLFIPSAAPFDLFMGERKHGLQLYVKTVFIGDDIKELLPDYLRFVRGVVESSDLPLNVSREMLQDDVIIRRIRKTLVTRILGKLEELQKGEGDD